MLYKSLAASVALGLSVLTSCGYQEGSKSALQGHYEDGTASKLESKAGTIRAAAEYEPSQGVVISLPLISSFGHNDFAAALVNSGIETLWVTVPSDFNGNVKTSPVFSDLRKRLGSKISKVKLVKQQLSGSLTVWARDWSPQSSIDQNGNVGLIDFNYFPERNVDDFTAQSMERLLDFDRVSVPVYNEGGNFMNTRQGHCIMTTRVTDANDHQDQSDDLILNAQDIEDYYRMGAGCSKVTILPRMPYEGTGHIDMWAKFLNDDTVIVSDLRDEEVDLYIGRDRSRAQTLQDYFNARALDISNLGYKVIRLPIPGPAFAEGKDMFRSYSNSIIVNDQVIIPRYEYPANDIFGIDGHYMDEHLLGKYEEEVQAVYESQGFAVTWITADDLIAIGGAVHCTTMQIASPQ